MSVLLVDDHALVRAGLTRLLGGVVQGPVLEASNGRDALALAKSHRPDLIILDLNLPGLGGLELLGRLIAQGASPILVLSMHGEPLYARRALDAGAAGYATKNISPDELVQAVRRILGGGRYVEAELAQALAMADTARASGFDALSPRELEIMRLLAKGASLAEIAAAIGVGYKTVANIASQIKSKLGVSRTADLVRLAVETGVHS
ncbi:MAG TPA: response regulator transcription factor [Caulobacteraceae bacterium]|jgi:two-component system invasion response regulator UvrY|nr:response regulator transcription factor [Caulobacteraceae bacterium]